VLKALMTFSTPTSPRSYDFRVVTVRALPETQSTLLGRAAEVEEVRDSVRSSRLVTITGPPGVGKTRVALAAVGELSEDVGTVAWVDLAPVRESTRIIAEIARALGVGRRDTETAIATVSTAIAGRDALVVLDNCEHLLDGVAQISELLTASPRMRILATSRERLHLSAEVEIALPPLPMPTEAEVADLNRLGRNPSIALLLARSPTAVQLTPRTSQALVDICITLDGLPLAIELAAARLRVFSPSELAFRLGRRGAALTSSARDLPGRHRDISSAIAWSHDLLPENERMVFRRLSVFAGTWTVSDAVAVCPLTWADDVVAAVESLLDKSLIGRADAAREDGEARFSMLFSVREFAADRLDEAGEADDARDAHLQHFADVAGLWERTVGTNDENATWTWTDFTRTDLIAALHHGQERHDVEATLKLVTTLGWYSYTRGSLADVAELREFVTAADRGVVDSDVLAAALVSSGVVAVGLGDDETAERDLAESLEISEKRGDERRIAIASAFLGHAARHRGAYELAAERHRTARAIYEKTGNHRGTAWASHDLGLLAYETGDYGRAEADLRDALRGFRGIGYDWAVAVSGAALAATLIATGDIEQAPALLREALLLHDVVSDRRGVAQCLESLAELAAAQGLAATAARLLGAAEAVRTTAAARPSPAEHSRLTALHESVDGALGSGQADHEHQAGVTMPPIAAIALAAAFAATRVGDAQDSDPGLTPRQRDVAALVAAGCTNRQIGRALGITEKTAEVHVRNIMERLHAPSRAGVAAWAASRGLTAPNTA
jgi:predicted ATPase/DNA-binding NarL/FixJ family response regulator